MAVGPEERPLLYKRLIRRPGNSCEEPMWRRIELRFAGGVRVRFSDREHGLRQVEVFAEKGTWHPVVVYGPEGCGKTAFSRQAIEVLKSHGYSVVYLNRLSLDIHLHPFMFVHI